MQPDRASAVVTAKISSPNARATPTGATPHSETAKFLHRLWLTNRFSRGDAAETPSPRCRGQRRRTRRSGADAGADRTRPPGAAEPAIAGRVLGQILLMIVLGEIELAGRPDLRGDGAETFCLQRLLVGDPRCVSGFALGIAGGVDRGTILGSDVVALAHPLGRVVALPENLQQPVVGDFLRIEHHKHRFGMSGAARTDLLVSR